MAKKKAAAKKSQVVDDRTEAGPDSPRVISVEERVIQISGKVDSILRQLEDLPTTDVMTTLTDPELQALDKESVLRDKAIDETGAGVEKLVAMHVAMNNKLTNLADAMTEFFEANKKVAVAVKSPAAVLKSEPDTRIDDIQANVNVLCTEFCALRGSLQEPEQDEPVRKPGGSPRSSVQSCIHTLK